MLWKKLEEEFSTVNLYTDLLPSFCARYKVDLPSLGDIKINLIHKYRMNGIDKDLKFVKNRGNFIWIVLEEPWVQGDRIDTSDTIYQTFVQYDRKYRLCKLRKMFEWNSLSIGLVEVVSTTIEYDPLTEGLIFDTMEYTTQWELINLSTVAAYAILLRCIYPVSSKSYICWEL